MTDADANQALKDGLAALIHEAVLAARRANEFGQHSQQYNAFAMLRLSAEQQASSVERVGNAIAAIIEAERPAPEPFPQASGPDDDFPFEHRDTHAETERSFPGDMLGFGPNLPSTEPEPEDRSR